MRNADGAGRRHSWHRLGSLFWTVGSMQRPVSLGKKAILYPRFQAGSPQADCGDGEAAGWSRQTIASGVLPRGGKDLYLRICRHVAGTRDVAQEGSPAHGEGRDEDEMDRYT